MFDNLSFGKRVAAGFGLVTALTVAIGLAGVMSVRDITASKDRIIRVEARGMVELEALRAEVERKSAMVRAYLLTRDGEALAAVRQTRQEFKRLLGRLKSYTVDAENLRLLAEIEQLEEAHEDAYQRASRDLSDLVASGKAFSEKVWPIMGSLREAARAFRDSQQRALDADIARSEEDAAGIETLLIALVVAGLAIAIGASTLLSRLISRQVGGAINRVQSSAAELQSAASQQASSTKEQSSAMSEISTTINELLVTSRQIADSAQRVSQIADGAARSARTGQEAVGRTGDALNTIKRQVDLIVQQMLELGRKSQHIGGILDIINELADQTNILSINATIEAAGAGEYGRRFAVVADEIRRLADRVSGSTREIRGLIDEVRSSVNAAVMTTEGGTKAVDAGARQFEGVSGTLREVVASSATTTEAAREIELSTKQQATAVSQVNVAIASVAQATREAEASATQTYQTAAELGALARDLARLIWARNNGGRVEPRSPA